MKKLVVGLALVSLGLGASNAMACEVDMEDYWVTAQGDGTVIASNTDPIVVRQHKGDWRIQFPNHYGGYIADYSRCSFQVTAIGDPGPDSVAGINSQTFGTVGFQNSSNPRVQVKMYRFNNAVNPDNRYFSPRDVNFSLVLHCVSSCNGY